MKKFKTKIKKTFFFLIAVGVFFVASGGNVLAADPTSGVFVSKIKTLSAPAYFDAVSWEASIPAGTSIKLKVRSDNNGIFEEAGELSWSDCTNEYTLVNGSGSAGFSINNCLTMGHGFLQYRAELSTTDGNSVPTLDSVTFSFKYPSTYIANVTPAIDTNDADFALVAQSGSGFYLDGSDKLFLKKPGLAACSVSNQCVSEKCTGGFCEIACRELTMTHDGIFYGAVEAADGRCWLDRNLGASRVATSFNDSQSYGWLFQWGRGADGHQISTSATTATLSSTDNPGHGNFITNLVSPYDWRNPQNDNLWQGVDGVNNPCPSGFRLPTQPEWATLVSTEGITNYTTAASSALRLTSVGIRFRSGAFFYQSTRGYYWSSTPSSINAFHITFDSSSIVVAGNNLNRTNGFSVRCVKN